MRESWEKPGLPATLTLASSLVAACFLLLLPLVYRLAPTVSMPDPVPPNHQTAESLLYLLTVLLVVAAVLWVPTLASRWSDRNSPGAFGMLAAFAAGGVGAVVLIARLLDQPGSGLRNTLILAFFWWIAFSLLFLGGGPFLARLASRTTWSQVIALTAVLFVLLGAASLVDRDHVNVLPLLICLALAGIGTWLWARVRLPQLGGWKGRIVDLVVLALVLVAVPDVPVYRVGDLGGSLLDLVTADTMVFHSNLYLGAANEVLHGNYLLVDEVSQYGVGAIYALAAYFQLVPLGYGTLAIFDAALSAVVFAMGYVLLRLVGVGRTLAFGAILVAVIVLAWGLTFPIGGIPQNGPLRFGLLPISLILLRIVSIWFGGRQRETLAKVAAAAAWVVVGLSAIWALEALLYTSAALAGVILAETMLRPSGERRSWLIGQVLRTIAAWVVAHLAFALFTLAFSGSLPDWGMYISYLREFLTGEVGQFTYDFQPWTPALLLGFGYLVAAISVAVVVRLRPHWCDANRPAVIALAGLGTYGLVQFSYFVNRSLAEVLPYLGFPLLLTVAIWLALILRSTEAGELVKRGSVAVALLLAAVTVSTVWPDAKVRAGDSVLAYGLPGGKSLRGGIDRLFNMPPLKRGADEGERLLREYIPGESPAVLTHWDLDQNILIRDGRVNRLGFADSKEASWVPAPHYPAMLEAVAGMKAGDRMLVDEGALTAFDRLQADPEDIPEPLGTADGLTPIQLEALSALGRRFDLRVVVKGKEGLRVVELVPRSQ